jgi:hypothetical protein
VAQEEGPQMNEKKEVKCGVCGIEGTINIHRPSMQSVMFHQDEMRRRCKLASNPGFNFDCEHLQEAIREATLPSGKRL